ncbi:T20D4.11-like domain-containing protein [Caenorhabditis elegans]|uniref:T20D4.11-like domain-containing protein n=1 Tax=Caenorhabditis elegans TaxID=6239 RepID=Q20245_CAEEL|nr:DUF19 domain-containing protein [Caenorhabditis elegans]CAB01182.1 DUF19 domain-containing protein [Caenorhabditis elegans]|eukprot:NP_506533.1 Uncharacterized protein CELE_F40G12.6 [Caenorhabditis elegans]
MLVYCFIFLLLNSKVNGSSLQNETETIGKCDLLVGQLLSVLTSASDLQGEVNIDSFEKVSSKYTAVTECYGTLKSASAKRLKQLYNWRWEKHYFYAFKMVECFGKIINDQFSGNDSKCDYDITTNNLTKKRETLVSGKLCILSIAKEMCHSAAYSYLKIHYNLLSDTLSIKPENDNCESLHSELIREQCELVEAKIMNFSRKTDDESLSANNTISAESGHLCEVLQQCREDECNFINPEREFEICGVFPSNDTETSGNSTIIELYGALRSPIQVNSEVGTCASIVDEFAFIVSENTISSSPAYEYTLEICKNAVDCYNSLGNETAEEMAKSYLAICDRYQPTG